MARRPRVAPGLLYHVIVGGNQRRMRFRNGAKNALRGPDRRWAVTAKRAEAVTLLVREYGHRVSHVAKQLGREHANISMMPARYSARESVGGELL
jgi:hypothetical protein